jgi:signal peptidase II
MRKWQFFGLTMGTIVLADLVTKALAVRYLEFGRTLRVFGGALPLTLTFNTGAAFSLNVGDASRWFFLATSLFALVAILVFYHRTPVGNRLQLIALALISSGAVGNLIDRIRWAHGVVDFIGPINLGVMLWPVFNVADSAITCGAVLLALALWRSDRRPVPLEGEAEVGPAA